MVEGTVRVWIAVASHGRAWDRDRDAPRFAAAFDILAAHASRWPAPSQLLAAMPGAPAQARIAHDHGIPASREARLAKLQALLGPEYTPDVADPDFDPHKHHAMADRRRAEEEIAAQAAGMAPTRPAQEEGATRAAVEKDGSQGAIQDDLGSYGFSSPLLRNPDDPHLVDMIRSGFVLPSSGDTP